MDIPIASDSEGGDKLWRFSSKCLQTEKLVLTQFNKKNLIRALQH